MSSPPREQRPITLLKLAEKRALGEPIVMVTAYDHPSAAIVDDAGVAIGRVTSGTIGPSVDKPVALAYVPTGLAAPGTRLDAEVRGKRQPMQVVSLPFAPHRYFRG